MGDGDLNLLGPFPFSRGVDCEIAKYIDEILKYSSLELLGPVILEISRDTSKYIDKILKSPLELLGRFQSNLAQSILV